MLKYAKGNINDGLWLSSFFIMFFDINKKIYK